MKRFFVIDETIIKEYNEATITIHLQRGLYRLVSLDDWGIIAEIWQLLFRRILCGFMTILKDNLMPHRIVEIV